MRINGVGKLIAGFFVLFLAASALAIHESKPPSPPPEARVSPPVDDVAAPIDHSPPSRAIRDEVPPWVKYAAPAPPTTIVKVPPIDGDIPDAVDKCPDQPTDSTDDDGCPEPEGLKDRIILID